MKKIIGLLTIVAASISLADMVSINYYLSNEAGQYGRLDGAQDGVVNGSANTSSFGGAGYVAANWNNVLDVDGTTLYSESGITTTISATDERPLLNARVNNTANTIYNNTAMRAFIKAGTAQNNESQARITLGNMAANFSGSYDVVVYTGGSHQNNGMTVNLMDGDGSNWLRGQRGTHPLYSLQTRFTPGNYTDPVQSTNQTVLVDGGANSGVVGDYVVFTGVNLDQFTVVVDATKTNYGGLGAVQVVGTVIPEPATAGLLAGMGSLIYMARRKFSS
jgi:hypothetical protein